MYFLFFIETQVAYLFSGHASLACFHCFPSDSVFYIICVCVCGSASYVQFRTYIFTIISNMSITKCQIPVIWKTSNIVPVPKKTNVQCMNDLRPIALTSCIMKVFEWCLLYYLDPIVSNSIDPYQFAYRSKRSVEDAILHVMNNVYKHLEKPGSSVRLMFYDFSSAFNTIQPHLLCDKLIN